MVFGKQHPHRAAPCSRANCSMIGAIHGQAFRSKNDEGYRYYISSALLRGRKASAGSVGRVSAAEIERTIVAAIEAEGDDVPGQLTPSSLSLRDDVLAMPLDTMLEGFEPERAARP